MTEHFVQHQLKAGDWVRTKFKCEGPETALCKTICQTCWNECRDSCECAGEDPPREPVLKTGESCQLVEWLEESPEEAYAGPEDLPVRGPDWQPIIISWNGDCYEWKYVS